MTSLFLPLLSVLILAHPSLTQPPDTTNPVLPQPSTECPTLFPFQDPPPSPSPSATSQLPMQPISPNLSPYIASILTSDEFSSPRPLHFRCTATFITPTTLLLPATCVTVFIQAIDQCPPIHQVYLSRQPLITNQNLPTPLPETLTPISSFTIHPHFTCEPALFNIALAHLPAPLPHTKPLPISNNPLLPAQLSISRVLAYTKLTTQPDIRTAQFRKSQLDLPIFSQNQCTLRFNFLPNNDAIPFNHTLQVCVGDADRSAQCLQTCLNGGILIQYDRDNDPVLVAFHNLDDNVCPLGGEWVFLRAGIVIDWIRQYARGELRERGEVAAEVVAAALPAVPRLQSAEVDPMTSGMVVGSVVALGILAVVAVMVVVAMWRRWRRRGKGEVRRPEELFEEMEARMAEGLSNREVSQSWLWVSRGNVTEGGGGGGSEDEGCVRVGVEQEQACVSGGLRSGTIRGPVQKHPIRLSSESGV